MQHVTAEPRPAERTPHPTLADVAAEAAVSLSTASRALRDGSSVSEETRRRVRTAARRLGYEPNRLARSLRMRSSTLVGVIVPDTAVGFYARVVKGAQDVLEREGYQVRPRAGGRPHVRCSRFPTLRPARRRERHAGARSDLRTRAAGLRVPEDVAVVSFDDLFFGDLLDPPITALARAEAKLGGLAASLLLHALRTGSVGPPPRCGCRSS